jgi:hypothetical protein
MSLNDYRDRVARLIRERTGEALLNGTLDHAAAITQEAFASAEQQVRILSNRLSPDCYAREGVRNAAKFFLADTNHKLRILVESSLWDSGSNFNWSQHPLISDLLPFAASGRLEMKAVPREWVDRYKFNFLLLDDYGFRYEADRARAAAVATFFPEDKKTPVESLAGNFEQLWEVSTEIKLN